MLTIYSFKNMCSIAFPELQLWAVKQVVVTGKVLRLTFKYFNNRISWKFDTN